MVSSLRYVSRNIQYLSFKENLCKKFVFKKKYKVKKDENLNRNNNILINTCSVVPLENNTRPRILRKNQDLTKITDKKDLTKITNKKDLTKITNKESLGQKLINIKSSHLISSSDSSISIISNESNINKNNKEKKLKDSEVDSDKSIFQKYQKTVSNEMSLKKFASDHQLYEDLEYRYRQNPTQKLRPHSGPAPYKPFKTISSTPLVTTKGHQASHC